MKYIKTAFCLFLFALMGICSYAQEDGLNDYYSKKYNPRLSPSKGNINLFIGYTADWNYGGSPEIGIGYQWTDRWQVGINICPSSDDFKIYGVNCLYTYDAIPSLDGGLFFRIGAELGAATYWEEDDHGGIYTKSSGYCGPILQLQHQLCDWFSIYTRARGVIYWKEGVSFCASIGICVSLQQKKISNLFSKKD